MFFSLRDISKIIKMYKYNNGKISLKSSQYFIIMDFLFYSVQIKLVCF